MKSLSQNPVFKHISLFKLVCSFALVALTFPVQNASAEESSVFKKFGGTIGGSYEIGSLGNSGMGLQDRTMSAVSLEALLGYRLDTSWIVGVDFNYRFQQQQTSLSGAGGTNLAGKGYLLGIGAQYRFTERWAVQAALDLLGNYNFDRQTANSEDDHLESPLGLRVKAQYFLWEAWSVDASAGYHRWSTFQVTHTSHSEASNQWMVGVGITFHGFEKSRETVVTSTVVPSMVVQHAPVDKIFEKEKTAGGYKLNIPSAAFAFAKADLNADIRSKIVQVGAELAKYPRQKIIVKGHTDSIGSPARNEKLSLARANTVKAALIEGGVSSADIETIGVGSREPLVSNETQSGRDQNRRVEIIVLEEETK